MKTYYSDVRDALKLVYESDLNGTRGIKSRSADRVVATIGYEGAGKSNFSLIAMEEWYKFTENNLKAEELAKQISAKPSEFARIIKTSKALDYIMVDEGVLLAYGRNAMSDVSKNINTLLMVCRAKHFYINILIPNLLDLDTYLRKNRITAIWVMLPNWRVAYFSKRRVRKLLGKMAFMNRSGEHADPMKQGILPNFVATVPMCDNEELVKLYTAIKESNMNQVIDTTVDSIMKDKDNGTKPKKGVELTPIQARIVKMRDEGLSQKEIAIKLKIDNSAISRYEKVARRKLAIISSNYNTTPNDAQTP